MANSAVAEKNGTPPWEHRRWRGGVVRHRQAWEILLFFFAGTAFAGAGIWMLIGNSRDTLRQEWPLPIVIATVLLLGTGLGIAAFVLLFRWLCFRDCQVRMRTMPGVIGGHFVGEVFLPASLPNDADVRLELLCESTTNSPGSEGGNTSISIDWSYKVCIRSAMRQAGNSGRVPFDFTIPYGLHDETDEFRSEQTNTSTTFKWHLRVMAELPGADLNLKFHVPVFNTAASDPTLTQVPESGADLPLEKYLDELGEKQRIRIEAGRQGPVYVGGITPVIWSSLLVHGFISLMLGVGGIGILGFAAIQAIHLKGLLAPQGTTGILTLGLSLLSVLGPGGIGVILAGLGALVFSSFCSEFISRRTWIANGTIYQSRSLLGIPLPARSVSCEAVERVGIGDKSGDGHGKWFSHVDIVFKNPRRTWRSLFASCPKFEGPITVATSIPTRRETDAVINALRNHINQQRNAPLADDGEEDEGEKEKPGAGE
jgi:hypothetical protein